MDAPMRTGLATLVARICGAGVWALPMLWAVAGTCSAQPDGQPGVRAPASAGAGHSPLRRKPQGVAAEANDPQHGLSVTTWFSLGDDPSRSSLIRAKPGLYAPPTEDASENIFVFSRRSHAQEEQWWPDSKSGLPLYESSNSDAAQPLVPYAAWTSPEQQRLTSSIKNAMDACGVLMIACPNPP